MIYDTFQQTLNPRYNNLQRLMETFPHRKFVLVSDTTPGSALKTYVKLAKARPDQVQCIIARDVSATEPANWITPDLKGLRRLKGKYILFKTPADLTNTTNLMRRLHDGESAGCGGIDVDTGAHGYGPMSSSLISAWRAINMFTRCSLLLWKRPHVACLPDRREGTWYHHGGYEPRHDHGIGRVTGIYELPKDEPSLGSPIE
jgi:hypothetical protein